VKTALLDLNLLTALLWPTHEHHEPAHRWFRRRSGAAWATCPLTELGFVRLVTNPAFSRDALSPAAAIALLEQNLAHPGHEFWPDTLPVPRAITAAESLQGYRQLADAYLVALASQHEGVLATFDGGVRSITGKPFESAVEIVATR
jgi:toxin-antitoxin system PIN domain toxin